MLASWPVSIVTHGLGLNITVQSYCGSLDFGIIAARMAVPDLDPLVRALHEAHAELQRCGRRSGARPRAWEPVKKSSRAGGVQGASDATDETYRVDRRGGSE